jgi:glycosyltransferase involved in cell wall biosynthesis
MATVNPTNPARTAAPASSPPGERLRVALLITDLDVGGAERALVELARRLDRQEFEVRVWSLASPSADRARSLVPVLQEAGMSVQTLGARGARDALRVVRRLTAEWRTWRPDILQTSLFHANMLGRLAAWRAGVPHVVSGIRVAERRGRWRLRVDRWTDRLVDRHVCVSQAVAEFSCTEGGLSASKLVVIPNGVDLARYDNVRPIVADELGVPAGRQWITYVGRLDPQKGSEWLLDNASSWLTTAADHDLLLVGDGPLRARMENLVRAHQLAGCVHFVGWRGDVPRILAASRLLVLPSLWEGMPNVVLEAMASSRPVLATDVEGVRELLGPDADPQVVAVGDADAWNAKLLALVRDPQLAAQLGARNRQRVAERFTLDRVTGAYAQLYRAIACPGDSSDQDQ